MVRCMDDIPTFTDRQARAVILAAEAAGFEREDDLYEVWYDRALHDDARYAAEYLAERDLDALRAAMVADEPIPASVAAERITNSGRFTTADVELVIEVAAECGFTPPESDMPLLPVVLRYNQAQDAVAYLWEHHSPYWSSGSGGTPASHLCRTRPATHGAIGSGRRWVDPSALHSGPRKVPPPTGRARASPSGRRC